MRFWPFGKKKEEPEHREVGRDNILKATKPGSFGRGKYHICRQCGRKFFGHSVRPICCGYSTDEDYGFFDLYLAYIMMEMMIGDPGYDDNSYCAPADDPITSLMDTTDLEASLSAHAAAAEAEVERSPSGEQAFMSREEPVDNTDRFVSHESPVVERDPTPSYESHDSYESSSSYESSGGGGGDCGGGGGD